MNAGFSSLAALKAQLLNEALREDTSTDALILAIGLGLADKVEGYCNRKFARVVGDAYTTTGGRASVLLPRYPVESVTGLDVRDRIASGWVDSLLALDAYSPESGNVSFATPLDYAQIRVTYTGGYWWDVSEDADTPDLKPAEAAALPAGIRSAWFLQCQHVWRRIDKLGISIGKADEDNKLISGMSDLDLTPIVKAMLTDWIRYALT